MHLAVRLVEGRNMKKNKNLPLLLSLAVLFSCTENAQFTGGFLNENNPSFGDPLDPTTPDPINPVLPPGTTPPGDNPPVSPTPVVTPTPVYTPAPTPTYVPRPDPTPMPGDTCVRPNAPSMLEVTVNVQGQGRIKFMDNATNEFVHQVYIYYAGTRDPIYFRYSAFTDVPGTNLYESDMWHDFLIFQAGQVYDVCVYAEGCGMPAPQDIICTTAQRP